LDWRDSAGSVLEAHALVISTGASANYLGLASEEKFKNRGVSACAVCDGALPRFRNKPLVVVGGGDTAAEEGNYLTKFASEVYLVHRRDVMRASPIMADRLLKNPKVKPVWNSVVEEVFGDDEKGMHSVRVKNVHTQEQTNIEARGCFVAIGHTPNTKFSQDNSNSIHGLRRSERSLPHDDERRRRFRGRRRRGPGLQAGDHRAGMGCKAALDAERGWRRRGFISRGGIQPAVHVEFCGPNDLVDPRPLTPTLSRRERG